MCYALLRFGMISYASLGVDKISYALLFGTICHVL